MKRALLFAAVCLAAYGADPQALVRKVLAYDYGRDPAAVRELETLTLHAAGTAEAPAIEKLLLNGLASARTIPAKDAFCRNLAWVGSEAAIPALAGMLSDPATAEMARSAIERIGGPKAVEALHAALLRSSPPVRSGIAASLGRLHDEKSVAAIRALLQSSDAAAAAEALGRIASPAAREALLAAAPTPEVSDALLRIARESHGVDAIETYRRLSGTEHTVSVRAAALQGLARVDAREAKPLLEAALRSGPAPLQATAVRELARIEGIALADEMPHATELMRVQIISALGDSGRPELRPVLLAGATHQSAAVRIVSLAALAKLGTAADVAMLAERAAASSGDEQAAARAALAGLRDPAADAAVLKLLSAADPKTKLELIRAVGARGIPSAAEVLLQAAEDPNRAVRLESIRALRDTATSPQVPGLLQRLAKAGNDTERRELERSTASAIRRSPGSPFEDVSRAYEVTSDSDVRASLLNVAAAVGSAEGLSLLRQALRDPDADLQLAAVRAMSSWPTSAPLADLLNIAKTTHEPARRVLALRGYIQVVQIPSSRNPAETAGLLETAMSLASRPEEKRAVLGAVQKVVCPEALRLARSALNDPEVAAEARVAATTLQREMAYLKQ
jgi:HEAT repeat protein